MNDGPWRVMTAALLGFALVGIAIILAVDEVGLEPVSVQHEVSP